MSNNLLTVSTSPHILGGTTVRSMHLEFILALVPALVVGLYYFGLPAVITVALAIASAVATELLYTRLRKIPDTVMDMHAALLGLLLGMILPAGAPWWLPLVGGLLTVGLGKLLFGGLGGYPMNPVLIAWAALSLSWPEHMNSFYAALGAPEVTETPLMALKYDAATLEVYRSADLWLGLNAGAIGATCTWALLAGGIYLVIRKLVPWQIPLGVLAGVIGMSYLAAYTDPKLTQLGYTTLGQVWTIASFHLATGGLMIAAFFLAPEPVSSPMTPWGTLLYGLGIGFMTVIVRSWGSPVDGVFFAVLVMNAATPLFDRIRPKVLGKVVGGA